MVHLVFLYGSAETNKHQNQQGIKFEKTQNAAIGLCLENSHSLYPIGQDESELK